MLYPRLAVSGLALIAAAPAFAQEYDLGTIVIDVETGAPVEFSTGTLLKSSAEIAKTPRSVSVVTAQEIHEQGAEDVEEAPRYTTGVASGEYGLDDRSDWYTIRGFRPPTFHDGLQARYGFYNDTKPEPFLLDTIQVLRQHSTSSRTALRPISATPRASARKSSVPMSRATRSSPRGTNSTRLA